MDLNRSLVNQELLSATGQPASIDHQLPSIHGQPPSNKLQPLLIKRTTTTHIRGLLSEKKCFPTTQPCHNQPVHV